MTTLRTPEDFASKTALERCQAFVVHQLRLRTGHPAPHHPTSGPALTISHQTGAGEHVVAERVAHLLEAGGHKGAVPWTVFDRDLVDKVLEEHNLPHSLAQFMPEDRRSLIQDTLDELLGTRLPSWSAVPQVAETVLHLAHAGHAILVGRGANVITAGLPRVFHVRLVGSQEGRIARIQEERHLSHAAAATFVKKADRAHGRYVKAYYHVSAEDDTRYHLILNTDLLSLEEAAWIIAEAAQRSFRAS